MSTIDSIGGYYVKKAADTYCYVIQTYGYRQKKTVKKLYLFHYDSIDSCLFLVLLRNPNVFFNISIAK